MKSSRPSRSSTFCLYCSLTIKKDPKTGWQNANAKGTNWTIAGLTTAFGSDNILINNIPMENIIVGILHLMIGLYTYLFNIIMIFIRDRVEDDLLPVKQQKQQLDRAQKSITSKKTDIINLTREIHEAKQVSKALNKKSQSQASQAGAPSSKSSHSTIINVAEENNNKIKSLGAEIKQLVSEEKMLKSNIDKAKRERQNRPVESAFEDILDRYKISYKHSQTNISLTGDMCRRLSEHFTTICDELNALIQDKVDSKTKDAANSMFVKLKILASILDSVCAQMNSTEIQDKIQKDDFRVLCRLFEVFWRKCHLRVTPKVHQIGAHLPDLMDRFGRLGIFSENPVERIHIVNKSWDNVLVCMKSWKEKVKLKNLRKNIELTEDVSKAIENFKNREPLRSSKKLKSDSQPVHETLKDLLKAVENFDLDEADRDSQFEEINLPEDGEEE